MGTRPDRGGIDQGSHGDVQPLSVPDPRAAPGTMRVMVVSSPTIIRKVPTSINAELVARDAGERLEGGAGGAAAVRAMTVHRMGGFAATSKPTLRQ